MRAIIDTIHEDSVHVQTIGEDIAVAISTPDGVETAVLTAAGAEELISALQRAITVVQSRVPEIDAGNARKEER